MAVCLTTQKYTQLLSFAVLTKNPKSIVQIGVFSGDTLKVFRRFTGSDSNVTAFDEFSQYPDHVYENICNQFASDTRFNIRQGNLSNVHSKFSTSSIDFLHVDCGNDGATLKIILDQYLPKLKLNGVIFFEGGSEWRDKTEWMIIHNKLPITPVIESAKKQYPHCQFLQVSNWPAVLIITKT